MIRYFTLACIVSGILFSSSVVAQTADNNSGVEIVPKTEEPEKVEPVTITVTDEETGKTYQKQVFESEMGFTDLAEASKHPQMVRSLTLTYAGLTTFPKQILEMENLQVLNLYGNSITSIPEEIGTLKNLQYIDLRENNITALPQSIFKLDNLVRLQLEGNSISEASKKQLESNLASDNVEVTLQQEKGKK